MQKCSKTAANTATPDALRSALHEYRRARRFDASLYAAAKVALLNAYMRQYGLSACIVGLSGGVDSAVTLGLLSLAAKAPGSPIRRIEAVLLPMFAEGATRQEAATELAEEVAARFGVNSVCVDLSPALAAIRQSSEVATERRGSAWAAGQLVSYLRTPALYYHAALLSEQGDAAIVCGTTNRDEGAYIGFFGKASDGMVDLQLISDLHKSEVYKLAEWLDVPRAVREAPPTGDTYDGRSDVAMIGAPYDAVELYAFFLNLDDDGRRAFEHSLDSASKTQFAAWRAALERLHTHNAHKYLGDSPAVHLDVYERAVTGGWRPAPRPAIGIREQDSGRKARVGPIDVPPHLRALVGAARQPAMLGAAVADFGASAQLIDGVIEPAACDALVAHVLQQDAVPADIHGTPIDAASGPDVCVGSLRSTAYDPQLAEMLWSRLRSLVPPVRVMASDTPTDWHGHPVWRPVGLNPLLRFIRHEPGGELVPHYDAGYDYGDGVRCTLMSVVIYLTDGESDAGGSTRLLLEPQRCLPLEERCYADAEQPAHERDVLVTIAANRGSAAIFDHRLLHDSTEWEGSKPRLILRTDVIFERCAAHAIAPCASAPPDELWQRLGLPPTHDIAAIDKAYGAAMPTPARREAWKILRDPTYRSAYALLGSTAEVQTAGFFDDGLDLCGGVDEQLDPKWLSAPIAKIASNLQGVTDHDKPLVILASTGGFCPVHRGHLDMMEVAKESLEAQGKAVLGGYLCPDHDDYVHSKCGGQALSAATRLQLCEQAVAESSWLMVDRWAALHAPAALNFTTILQRLERLVAYQLRMHRPVEIVYVFGSDNARFALSFVGRGSAVCVARPGYEEQLDAIARHPLVHRNPRITMLSHERVPAAASAHVRRGDITAVPEAIKLAWQTLTGEGRCAESLARRALYMRYEGDWATRPWAQLGVSMAELARGYERFCAGLMDAMRKSFDAAIGADQSPTVALEVLDLRAQRRELERRMGGRRFISLDPCLPGTFDLRLSRCFDLLEAIPSVVRSNKYVARPNTPPLQDQLDAIPPGSYVLFDDDVATGGTVAAAQALLAKHCRIEEFVTLLSAAATTKAGLPRLDLVDCRDFLAGAHHAGLVVQLPGAGLARAPYVLPYVRPSLRASIPLSRETAFSQRVWELNHDFFASLGKTLRIRHMSPAFRALCALLGFPDDAPMHEHCLWQRDKLLQRRAA